MTTNPPHNNQPDEPEQHQDHVEVEEDEQPRLRERLAVRLRAYYNLRALRPYADLRGLRSWKLPLVEGSKVLTARLAARVAQLRRWVIEGDAPAAPTKPSKGKPWKKTKGKSEPDSEATSPEPDIGSAKDEIDNKGKEPGEKDVKAAMARGGGVLIGVAVAVAAVPQLPKATGLAPLALALIAAAAWCFAALIVAPRAALTPQDDQETGEDDTELDVEEAEQPTPDSEPEPAPRPAPVLTPEQQRAEFQRTVADLIGARNGVHFSEIVDHYRARGDVIDTAGVRRQCEEYGVPTRLQVGVDGRNRSGVHKGDFEAAMGAPIGTLRAPAARGPLTPSEGAPGQAQQTSSPAPGVWIVHAPGQPATPTTAPPLSPDPVQTPPVEDAEPLVTALSNESIYPSNSSDAPCEEGRPHLRLVKNTTSNEIPVQRKAD
ncbi:hypothetical protein [Streptomyces sp. cg36]|uniref:hypothetical protein n=1 Tax=Streptomyces sp. cg36 TaxID=3238798 RepID=UPI0034E2763F